MKPDRSPYRLVYGHLATKFEPLRNAILYASAMHLSKLGQLPRFAISPYRTVMRNSFRIAVQNEEAAWGLAATVLLSIVFDVSTLKRRDLLLLTFTGYRHWSRRMELETSRMSKAPPAWPCQTRE